ncbi:unnamed protein product [Boreogadus saida]
MDSLILQTLKYSGGRAAGRNFAKTICRLSPSFSGPDRGLPAWITPGEVTWDTTFASYSWQADDFNLLYWLGSDTVGSEATSPKTGPSRAAALSLHSVRWRFKKGGKARTYSAAQYPVVRAVPRREAVPLPFSGAELIAGIAVVMDAVLSQALSPKVSHAGWYRTQTSH